MVIPSSFISVTSAFKLPSPKEIIVPIFNLFCGLARHSQVSPISFKSSNSITWDNKAINEQINYRKNHPMNKEKLKDSKSKFTNALVENDEDDYSKGLKKVNQLNKNDGIIYKVISALYGQLKSIKRNKSCVTFGKFQRKIDMTEFYNATEKEKFFGADLRDEQKITLSNTLFNKIRKEVIEEN